MHPPPPTEAWSIMDLLPVLYSTTVLQYLGEQRLEPSSTRHGESQMSKRETSDSDNDLSCLSFFVVVVAMEHTVDETTTIKMTERSPFGPVYDASIAAEQGFQL